MRRQRSPARWAAAECMGGVGGMGWEVGRQMQGRREMREEVPGCWGAALAPTPPGQGRGHAGFRQGHVP